MRQQQGNQIRGALEQPVEPVIGFQTPPTDTGQPSASRTLYSTSVLRGRASVFSLVFRPSACGGHPLAPPAPSRGHQPPLPLTPAAAQKRPASNRVVGPAQLRQVLGGVQIAPIKAGGRKPLPFRKGRQGIGKGLQLVAWQGLDAGRGGPDPEGSGRRSRNRNPSLRSFRLAGARG